jgi:MerR family transcriptional regulator, copper efflux regulator
MRIGTVARQAEVGVETVRFYERKGLIRQPGKPVGGGYRRYSGSVVLTIRFIRQAQELGFSLREIRELLELRANPSSDCQDVQRRASEKLAEVEDKITRLHRISAALRGVIATCPSRGALDGCPILATMDSGASGSNMGAEPA